MRTAPGMVGAAATWVARRYGAPSFPWESRDDRTRTGHGEAVPVADHHAGDACRRCGDLSGGTSRDLAAFLGLRPVVRNTRRGRARFGGRSVLAAGAAAGRRRSLLRI